MQARRTHTPHHDEFQPARRLAQRHVVVRGSGSPSPLLARVRELEQTYRHLDDAPRAQTGAVEPMPGGLYVARYALGQIRREIEQDHFSHLPQLAAPPLKGHPRVWVLAQEITARAGGAPRLDQIASFVRAFQRAAPLTLGELRTLPVMLRLAVLKEPARAVTGLHTLNDVDWKEFFEKHSHIERILRRDPAGVYSRTDFDTRDRCRGEIEALARATRQSEEQVALAALGLAQRQADQAHILPTTHVGHYLLGRGHTALEAALGYRPSGRTRALALLRQHPTPAYLGGIALLTLLLVFGLLTYALVAGGTPVQLAGAALLALLPATATAVAAVNRLVTQTIPPRHLPRLDFRHGIPAGCRTMVVVPALLSGPQEVRSLLRRLECHYLGNADPHLGFALLTDFPDAPRAQMPQDDALLEQAQRGIRRLNRTYGEAEERGPFSLFHRRRQCNPREGVWMGWERKRGKLLEFNRLIGGHETSYCVRVAPPAALAETRYVITLDADTRLPRDSASRLVATLAHPLNRARFDPDSGRIVAGYTFLQPRVEIVPGSAGRSPFARFFSADTKVDLYARAVSNVYQDLFGEGLYAGKGIYDVAAFERCLVGRIPENTLLSHDLFEGIRGRAGWVSDVVLYEEYPANYIAYARRLHRWTRGDWQLLARRLYATNERMSAIDRWKILDNLRRSLLRPALLALLAGGWLWLPGSALAWTLVAMLTSATPVFAGALTHLRHGLFRRPLAASARVERADAARWLLSLLLLPYEALVTTGAVVTTLVRLAVTRRHLLQWTTAADTSRRLDQESGPGPFWRQMAGAPLLAAGLAGLIALGKPASLPVAAPFLLAWIVSPHVAYRVSRPAARGPARLSGAQQRRLRRLARRTWAYFERFAGEEDHWLPADRFQETPTEFTAHCTSPTNVGLALLCTLAAYDLGYLGLPDLTARLRASLRSMAQLERFRGHFFNWYDTHTLRPMWPRYVSTVDSGNLAGCLLTLAHGCRELPQEPILRRERWEGLLDTLEILGETAAPLQAHLARLRQKIRAAQDEPRDWPALLATLLGSDRRELERLADEAQLLRDLHPWLDRWQRQLVGMQREIDALVPWLPLLARAPALFDPAASDAHQALLESLPLAPTLNEIPQVCQAARARLEQLQTLLTGEMTRARDWCADLAAALDTAQQAAQASLAALEDLGAQARAWFLAMDWAFLFNARREVLHTGYNVETGQADVSHLDMLACEARIASLVAIATGQVPASHWLHLARPITRVGGRRALLSWGGTTLEYLMPALLVRDHEGTLLGESSRALVGHQIAYARQRGVPWGISESGCARLNGQKEYRYRTFGVPGLALRRDPNRALVITPYASLLALPFYPRQVMQNLERLVEMEMLGRFGLYEAIDFTAAWLPPGRAHAIVRSFMAHHQGMILLSLTNYLLNGVMVRRFHADVYIESVELLLHEEVPYEALVEYPGLERV